MNWVEQKIIKLEKMIRCVYCKIKNLTNIHNELDGLQGGQEGQYYHLTEEQYNNIDNIELTDEKIQITETTDFAQIGQNQKDFNKNVSDYKGVVDSNIQGLQTALDGKQDKLSSYDESILIENDGNIEANVSLFEEYFEQQECELSFEPIQIVAVYQDGIKLLNSEYEIILPKRIKIKEYVDENIQIEYTHLKS